jgi:hypothetical protein
MNRLNEIPSVSYKQGILYDFPANKEPLKIIDYEIHNY